MERPSLCVCIGSLALMLLVACSGHVPRSGRTHLWTGTAVSTAPGGGCLFDRKEAGVEGLGAAAVQALIAEGLNRLGAALAEAAQERTWNQRGSTNIEIASGERGIPRCFLVARGRFDPDPTVEDDSWLNGVPAELRDQLRTLMGAHDLHPVGPLDFLFEGLLRSSKDGSALAVTPTLVAYRAPIGTRFFRPSRDRHALLSIAFHTPGTPAEAPTNPSTEVILGSLRPGTFWYLDPDRKATTAPEPEEVPGPDTSPRALESQPEPEPPTPTPRTGLTPPQGSSTATPVSDGAANASTSSPSGGSFEDGVPFESRWFPLPRTKEIAPWTLTVTVFEKQNASEFMGFLAAVFQGSRPQLETTLQTVLVPGKAEETRLAELSKEIQLANAADAALGAALKSLQECVGAPTSADPAALRQAQRAANLTARAAKQDEPFGDSALVPINPSSSAALSSACARAVREAS